MYKQCCLGVHTCGVYLLNERGDIKCDQLDVYLLHIISYDFNSFGTGNFTGCADLAPLGAAVGHRLTRRYTNIG